MGGSLVDNFRWVRWAIIFSEKGFAMALACSASPVAAQLQQSLSQSASRGGAAAGRHGVSWASSFGSVRVFHSAQIRSGDLDAPCFWALATVYLPCLLHFLTTCDVFLSECY